MPGSIVSHRVTIHSPDFDDILDYAYDLRILLECKKFVDTISTEKIMNKYETEKKFEQSQKRNRYFIQNEQ